MSIQIALDRDQIADFSRRHHIRKLSLFGSVLRDDFGPQSDVDVLVEFEPDHVPGFFGLADMRFELEDIIGRTVDLRTPGDLSRYVRKRVVDSAEPLYVSG